MTVKAVRCVTAQNGPVRAAADIEGYSTAAKFGKPGRLSEGRHERNKTPAGRGTAGVLVRDKLGRLGLGGKKASGDYEFARGALLNLYKVAHSEMTVDKSNNSTSGFPQTTLAWAMFDVGYFPPNTPSG
jgi:hypothetical protein